jgi:CRP-like cAMP-binding protein
MVATPKSRIWITCLLRIEVKGSTRRLQTQKMPIKYSLDGHFSFSLSQAISFDQKNLTFDNSSNEQQILMQSLIKYFNLFQMLNQEAQAQILAISTLQELKKNTILQPIGHTCQTIYFIQKGLARIFYYKDGHDITEYFAQENQIIARVESLFSQQPSQKGIQLLEDAEVIAISATRLFALYDNFPRIERLFRKIFEQGYVDTVNRLESLQFHSAEERYQRLVQDMPDLLQRVPLKHIASYLGITQVSLSRIRAVWK